MNKQKSGKYSTFLIILFSLLTVLSYGFAAAIHSNTMINGWIPGCVSFALAAVSGITMWRLWRGLTHNPRFILNYTCNLIFATGLLLSAFYGLNFIFADNGTLHAEKAVVERKYYKVRHRTKRVSRRHYAQGEPYNVYYADIRFADGRVKDLSLPRARYSRIHIGDTLRIPVEKGLFNVPVIKRSGAPVDIPPSGYGRRMR